MPSRSVSSSDGAAEPSFDDLYRRRADDALRYATAILGGVEEARDACQEGWVKVWRAWGSADPDHVEAWAFRVIRNVCIDHQRARRNTQALDEVDLPAVLADDDLVADQVDAAARMAPLRKLAAPLREVLWLREVVDMTYAEIAEVQGVPIGTVMSRLHSARGKAARLLREDGK